MVAFFPALTDNLRAWALAQPIFFVSSAPTHGEHVNLSPKGYTGSNFAILGPNQCAYVDRTGSGIETISHIYENGRVTIMMCSFGTSPRIMRLFCRGRVIEWDSPEFEPFLKDRMRLKKVDSARAIIVLDIWKVQTSCGYGVPRVRRSMDGIADEKKGGPTCTDNQDDDGDGEVKDKDYQSDEENSRRLDAAIARHTRDIGVAGFEERNTLQQFNNKREREGTSHDYQAEMNTCSLDGLPGLRSARRDAKKGVLSGPAAARVRGVLLGQKSGMVLGFLLAVFFMYVAKIFGLILIAF